MNSKVRKIYKKMKPLVYSLVASFIIVSGWNWYHLSYRPHWRFLLISVLMWFGIFFGYQLFKIVYSFLIRRFNRHCFWNTEFKIFLDKLFFIFSLTFLVFFSKHEFYSFVYVSLILLYLFFRLHKYLSHHPDAKPWLLVNKNIFLLSYFIFILSGVFQYFAYNYYILDSNIKFYNIVIFRSFSITMFWLLGFSVSMSIYLFLRKKLKYALIIIWVLLFIAFMFFWAVNIGILIFSSLYLSPFMLSQVGNSGSIWYSLQNILIIIALLFVSGCFLYLIKNIIIATKKTSAKYWHFYNFIIIVIATSSFFAISSFKNTPEYLVARSFYKYFRGNTEKIELDPIIQKKLEKFGLFYNLDEFYIGHHNKIYKNNKNLLPEKFLDKKPNIVIVFLESFSSRLTGAYNQKYLKLTPNLNDFINNKNTTKFKNFYNASTPTITGIISSLCSILPPTGHNEIQEEKRLQNHHLLCLPKILKQEAGYGSIKYITSIDKNFSNKDSIFKSMGVNEVLGLEELSKYIKEKPLSWGYSDHQMYPVMWDLIKKEDRPFLYMMSTIDTHPPFNVSEDRIPYGTGGSDLLNSFHGTDDAFGKFWEEFKSSKFYEDTILIAVGDHAVFPTAYDKKGFPDEYGKNTFYDELFFGMYIPDNILPKEVDVYSSGIDFAPTLLQILRINRANSFEGHSIFDDRKDYQNLLGMHEFGLYINKREEGNEERKIDFAVPSDLTCIKNDKNNANTPLSLCEFLDYYSWKRQMFEEGRFWER